MNPLDQAVFLWFNLGPDAPRALVSAARGITQQLPHWMLAAALAVAAAGQPHWRRQAGRVLLSLVLAAALAALLKLGFDEPRPATLGVGTQWLGQRTSSSFPSRHAAMTTAFAVSAALAPRLRWPVRLALLLPALAMAWSRMALGLHFPSDVLAGSALGVLCALLVQWLARHREHRRVDNTRTTGTGPG